MAKKDVIINFRVKPHELDAIDARAEQEGLTRSNFLRGAINLALQQPTMSMSEYETKEVTPPSGGPACITGKIKGCQSALWVRTPGRGRVCSTCGVQTA